MSLLSAFRFRARRPGQLLSDENVGTLGYFNNQRITGAAVLAHGSVGFPRAHDELRTRIEDALLIGL